MRSIPQGLILASVVYSIFSNSLEMEISKGWRTLSMSLGATLSWRQQLIHWRAGAARLKDLGEPGELYGVQQRQLRSHARGTDLPCAQGTDNG